MQCLIDAAALPCPPAPAFWLNLQFNLLRNGFNKLILAGIQKHWEIPRLSSPDLPIASFSLLPCPAALRESATMLENYFLYLSLNGARELPDCNWLALACGNGGLSCLQWNSARACWISRAYFLARNLEKTESLDALANLPQAGGNSARLLALRDFSENALLHRGAVFLDRDGVLNSDIGYAHLWEQWQWIDGARESIRAMNDAGLLVFVVSNQSGVARGYFPEEDVPRLHKKVQEDLAAIGAHIDAFRYCPWLADAPLPEYRRESAWRKPKPGMIQDICQNWPVDLARSFLVGDKESDLAAGRAMGLPSFLFNEKNLDLAPLLEKCAPCRKVG